MAKFLTRFGRFVTLPMSLLTSILLARRFGVGVVGMFSVVMASQALCSTALLFGTNQAMWGEFKHTQIEEAIGAHVKLFAYSFSVGIPVMVVLWGLRLLLPAADWATLLVFLISLILAVICAGLKSVEVIKKKVGNYYIADLVYYGTMIVIAGLGPRPMQRTIVFWIISANCFAIVFLLIWCNRRIRWRIALKHGIPEGYVGRSFHNLIGGLAFTLGYRSPLLIAERFVSSAQLGVIAIFLAVVDGVTALIGSVTFADLNAVKDGDFKYFVLYVKKFVCCVLVVFVLAVWPGRQLVFWVYKINSEYGWLYVATVFAIPCIAFSRLVGNYFIVKNLSLQYLILAISFVVAILLSYVGLGAGNVWAVARGYLLACFATVLFGGWLLSRRYRDLGETV